MRSKHYLKGAIISVSLFAISCAKSELPEDPNFSTAQLSFNTTIVENAATKSNITGDIPEFYVLAYYTGEQLFQDYISSGNPPIANWMYNQLVERQADNTYSYTPITYWPVNTNDKISFVSYYAEDNTNVKIISPDPITKEGRPILEYTTQPENPTLDLLISQPVYDKTRLDGNVQMYMQHVQSRLQFAIKSTSINTKIISVGLKNVYTKAEFTAHGRVWYNHTDIKDLKTQTLLPIEQDLTGKFRLLSQYYLVIPQRFITSIVKPVLTFVFDDNGTQKSFEYTPASDWEKYNSYTYNITFAGDKIDVDVDVLPWSERNVDENIVANQYLRVSTRQMDLAQSHHLYYNSSFPTTSIGESATYPDNTSFILGDFYNVYFEGYKIRLEAKQENVFNAESFTIYIQGLDLHGHVIVRLPINVKTEKGGDIEIDGTFWAPGNIIYHDGHLEIAPNANYTGLYFRWGSLIGLAGNNAKSFQFIPDKSIGFRPKEYNHTISMWDEVPYEHTIDGKELDDAFEGRYDNKLGFDAVKALGDPCRYMSNQAGWTKGKWRMPTKAEYEAIVLKRKIRRINRLWGIADENHEHVSATTGVLAVEAGWFVKADMTDDTVPPDNEFTSSKPPKGWVFYPAAGQRGGYSGALSEYSTLGYYWTSTTTSWDAAYRFQFSDKNSGDNLGSFSDIASGFVDAYPIRCVRDTK